MGEDPHFLEHPNDCPYRLDVEFRDILDFIRAHISDHVDFVDESLEGRSILIGYREVALTVDIEPSVQPRNFTYFIVNREMPREAVDSLRRKVREFVEEYNAGSAPPSVSEPCLLSISLRILRLVEETTSHLLAYRQNHPSTVCRPQLVTALSGVDLSLTQDVAARILGKSPAEICESLLQDWRIMHCENIFRGDLCRRFLAKQQHMKDKLLKLSLQSLRGCVPSDHQRRRATVEAQKEDLATYLVAPRITFHGTAPQNVASIVQCGFLKPGDINSLTGKPHEISCGSTYGAGVYSSPNAAFSLVYSGSHADPTAPSAIPGLKLIVCATLMGRPASVSRGDDWREQSKAYPGADSHVANYGREYVVFDSAQILPCYVLHLDWRERDDVESFLQAKIRQPRPLHPRLRKESETLAPGDIQRQKQERFAQGKKFFAYGFGPLKGRDIVIEEIGETDDDEEDYGDYQKYRTDGDNEGQTSIWEWNKLEGETEFDEFAEARKAKAKKLS